MAKDVGDGARAARHTDIPAGPGDVHPAGAHVTERQARYLDSEIVSSPGGCVEVTIGEGHRAGAGQGQDPAVGHGGAEVARNDLVRFRHQRGDHGGRVLLAGGQHGIPPLLDVDGALQRPPAARADAMGDLVAAHPRGNSVGSREDEGKGGVGVHQSTVPQMRPPDSVIHRAIPQPTGPCSVQAAPGRHSGPKNRPEVSKPA